MRWSMSSPRAPVLSRFRTAIARLEAVAARETPLCRLSLQAGRFAADSPVIPDTFPAPGYANL
jgi:hypothetical protein